jgi:hypothetical protein
VSPRIVAATLRDLSYVAANLRPEDDEELSCQLPNWNVFGLAAMSLRDHAYCVLIDGNPEAAVGAHRVSNHNGLWVAWSWGTRRMWRAVPTISRFVRDVMIPDIIEQGGWRCEAKAMAKNASAHRWLERMGATRRADLPGWGMNGETFVLYEWVRSDVLLQPVRRPASAAPDRGVQAASAA